jgi:hypothetical protein
VIDVAIRKRARLDRQALTSPIDGHLTEAGHQYIAGEAAGGLHKLLAPDLRTMPLAALPSGSRHPEQPVE